MTVRSGVDLYNLTGDCHITTWLIPFSSNPICLRKAYIMLMSILGITLFITLSISLTRGTLVTRDFVMYWTAARLQLEGGNPYDPALLMELQRTIGWPFNFPLLPLMPPWAFFSVLPFGLISFPASQLLWLDSHLALLLFTAVCLWRYYGGDDQKYRIAWIVVFSFLPVYVALGLLQMVPLVLYGIVGFLLFEKRQQWFWAGASLVLAAVKPQTVYLLWPVMILWTLKERRWGLMVGAVVFGVIAGVLPLAFNARIYQQYLVQWARPEAFEFVYIIGQPNAGRFLEYIFNLKSIWLHFLPTILATIWALAYWFRRRESWSWRERIPILLFVSSLTTPYGFVADQIVFLPAALQLAVKFTSPDVNKSIKWLALFSYATINLIGGLQMLTIAELWLFWISGAYFLIYLLLRNALNRHA